jgi:hypothetical protein
MAVLRGDASNVLSAATVAETGLRRPDLLVAEVSGRGHVPFLGEAESLADLRDWLAPCSKALP